MDHAAINAKRNLLEYKRKLKGDRIDGLAKRAKGNTCYVTSEALERMTAEFLARGGKINQTTVMYQKSKSKNQKRKKVKLILIDNSREGERYNKWRRSILSRDNYKCVLCESTTRIEAHHITRWIDNVRLRFNQKNGVSLCFNCHQTGHNHNKEPFPTAITSTLKKYIRFKYAERNLAMLRKPQTDYKSSRGRE
jgi:5-methylcytosine-specific restriction endonuclease McrA